MSIHIPVTDELSSILNLLTGDQWKFTFVKTSMVMPKPKVNDKAKSKANSL